MVIIWQVNAIVAVMPLKQTKMQNFVNFVDVSSAVNVDKNNDSFHKNKKKILVFLEKQARQIIKKMKN